MAKLAFGPLAIDPIAIGSQGNAVLGIRDSGKTYTATSLAEGLFEAGIPFTAFDPIGVWRFLRVPGAGRGYPVVVAGGQDGDLPLTPASAPAIVEAAMANGVSIVIDLFDIHLSKADWKRIVCSCLEIMLHRNSAHGLRHVFLEEAAEFAPQQVRPDTGHVYAAVEKLARMGGNSRLGYTLINQRAEEVNKAVLELCDNLFLHRQKGRNSLTALSKWLDIGNVADHKAIISTLSTLPTGHCWAWLAGTERPVLVEVPPKNSLHPDRRVMRGDKAGHAAAQPVDVGGFVEAMRGQLVAVEEEAKANDPKRLKAEIASLRRQMAEAVKQKIVADPKMIEEAERRGRDQGWSEGRDLGAREGAAAAMARVREAIEGIGVGAIPAKVARPTERPRPSVLAATRPAAPSKPTNGAHPDLTGPQATFLQSLAWWKAMGHEQVTRAQLAAIAGWRVTSGHLKNVAGSLRTAGLIDYPTSGTIAMTEAGEAVAPEPDLSASLKDSLRSVLTGPQRLVFDVLVASRAPALTRDEVAEACRWEPTSGHVKNVLGSMRSLEVIEYPAPGQVALAEWVSCA